MVDVSVSWVVLFEGLVGRSRHGVRKIHRLGQHQVPMTAEVAVHFFRGNDQEVLVAHLARAFKIELLLVKALGPGIGEVGIVVKVCQDRRC